MSSGKTALPAAFLVLVSMAVIGCVSPEEQAGFRADAPTMLRPAARTLRGVRFEDLVVQSRHTVADVPVTTGLVRKVAEDSRDAVVSIFVKTQTPYRLKLLPFGPRDRKAGVPEEVISQLTALRLFD